LFDLKEHHEYKLFPLLEYKDHGLRSANMLTGKNREYTKPDVILHAREAKLGFVIEISI
jgi:hypothetical protein